MRKLSAELRRRTGEVETIFDLLPIGIGIADDPECRDIRVNKAFADQLGISTTANASLSAPEAERPAFKVVREGRELAPEELPMQVAAREGVNVREFEVDVLRPDGQRVSLYEYAAPLLDEHGDVRGSLGVFINITARRRIEQEQRFLAEASRVLASSLDYNSTLQALARLAVPVFGEYCAIDVQREDGRFERIELVVQEPSRQPIADALKAFPPALSVDSPAARAIRTGETVVSHDCPPELLEQSAQSPAHLELLRHFAVTSFVMVPLRARGRTLGLLTAGSFSHRRYDERDKAFAEDVAARAALALDNALLYRDAQEANRLKEDFLATLSHELRTPLNALLGWTQILKAPHLDEAARSRALTSIERNARAQAVLIDDLLDLSRVTSGKLRLNQQVVDIPAVVLGAVDSLRPAARARDIELSAAVVTPAGEVLGDPDRLQQVVWNLLSNSVKFTPPGGRIDVSVEEPAGAVQITVTDSGQGITAELLPFVFERFRQGDSSTTRAQGGLGLGLAIVRHLVDLHGGSVEASSGGTGAGARFIVTLPARSHGVATAPRRDDEAGREVPLAGMRILGLDGHEDTRELLLSTLRSAGADVMVVGSVDTALVALDSFRPRVIVADTDERGGEHSLARELRARGGRMPPVIALSGRRPGEALEDHEKQALETGFAARLVKPVDGASLVATIVALNATLRP
ncbi:MAG: GAF domain-containing protein [Acidobacteria bacterium]|nr:GAF domain-containing protein [Acidobacteriota bacterium]